MVLRSSSRRLAFAVATGFCALVAGPSSARAQSPPVLRPEFVVNTFTDAGQGHSDLAADGLGNLVAVWSSFTQDGSGWGVFGQRLSSAGAPLGDEFQVNSFTTGDQNSASVAADAAGDFVVVWTSAGQDGSGAGVFGQRFDADGVAAGSEFQVNSTSTGNQSSPKVALSALGGFIVVWSSEEQDGSAEGVFGQRFSNSGAPLGNEFQVNTFTPGWQSLGEIAAGPAGDFIVVWDSQDQDGSGRGVFGQRFDAGGAPAGSEFQVNTVTTGDEIFPAVAQNGAGDFVVTWSSDEGAESNWRVLAQRFGSDGLAVGGEIAVSGSPEHSHLASSVAMDEAGSFFLAWTTHVPSPIPLEDSWSLVFGRRYSAAGSPLEDEFRVNLESNYTGGVEVVANGPQSFAASWHTLGGFWHFSLEDVYAKIYAVPFFADGFDSGVLCGWSAAVGSGEICP